MENLSEIKSYLTTFSLYYQGMQAVKTNNLSAGAQYADKLDALNWKLISLEGGRTDEKSLKLANNPALELRGALLSAGENMKKQFLC